MHLFCLTCTGLGSWALISGHVYGYPLFPVPAPWAVYVLVCVPVVAPTVPPPLALEAAVEEDEYNMLGHC